MTRNFKGVLCLCLLSVLAACTTSPPKSTNNICDIFEEKRGWYDDAKESSGKWGSSIATMMAIIHQESRFVADAKPPRKKYLGFSWPQAFWCLWLYSGERKLKGVSEVDGQRHDRDDFADAIYFVGWNDQSNKRTNPMGYGEIISGLS